MKDLAEQPSGIFIGKMPAFAENPLFQVIGVAAYLEHVDVVIGLQKHAAKTLQVFHGIIVIVPEICADRHCLLSLLHPVCHRLGSIVGNPEGLDQKLSDLKRYIRMDLLKQGIVHFS